MTDGRSSGDGVDDGDGRAGADATDAIDLLADETRVAILRELAEHKRAEPEDPTLSFTDLRERVGVVDSGQFNYHLQKLCDRFVREGPEGYELGYRGQAIIDAAAGAVRTSDAAQPDGGGDTGECEVCGEPDCNRRIHIHLGWR